MQEIVSQAEYYGLPSDHAVAPPPEKVADQLRAPTPWERPMRAEAHE